METATETKFSAEDFLKEISLEIDRHNDALEILIGNANFDRKQIDSLRKFASDEEATLKSKIQFVAARHEQQLANHELITVSEHSELFATHLRLKRDLTQSFETLVLSEIMLFKKNIAKFILLLEI